MMGFLAQVPFDDQVDPKPIHANVRQILVDDTVLNISIGGGVCRGALVHTKTLCRQLPASVFEVMALTGVSHAAYTACAGLSSSLSAGWQETSFRFSSRSP